MKEIRIGEKRYRWTLEDTHPYVVTTAAFLLVLVSALGFWGFLCIASAVLG